MNETFNYAIEGLSVVENEKDTICKLESTEILFLQSKFDFYPNQKIGVELSAIPEIPTNKNDEIDFTLSANNYFRDVGFNEFKLSGDVYHCVLVGFEIVDVATHTLKLIFDSVKNSEKMFDECDVITSFNDTYLPFLKKGTKFDIIIHKK